MDRIIKLTQELENTKKLDANDEFDQEIIELSIEAHDYLLSHPWCDKIQDTWLAISWGYTLSVFLCQIKSDLPEVDEYIWMIVGDIPSAYVDILGSKTGIEAILSYIDMMSQWIEAVETNESIADFYPVELPATLEYAGLLKARLELIIEELIPEVNE